MRKLLLIIIPFLTAILVFVIVFLVVNKNSGKGALQVTSMPSSQVYIDGKMIGQTPLCKCDANNMIPSGVHTVKLVPTQGNFEPFEQKITISPSVLTVVDRTFGPSGAAEGSVINLTPLTDKKDAQILVVSFPDNAQVSLDNNPSGQTPFLLKNVTASDHELKLTRDGYKNKTVRIRTVAGYKLETLVFLGVDLNTATSSALPAPSITPSEGSPTPSKTSEVLILETPTGFLRVREMDSIASSQIALVYPGEKYELISEKESWFQIKLKDGKTGWISSQYSQKTD